MFQKNYFFFFFTKKTNKFGVYTKTALQYSSQKNTLFTKNIKVNLLRYRRKINLKIEKIKKGANKFNLHLLFSHMYMVLRARGEGRGLMFDE